MNKHDPRVQRTHQALQEALIDLAAVRGFDTITVGDIAKHAKVNRATFYRHYQDKYDVLDQIFQDMIGEFARDLEPPSEVAIPIDPQNPPARWVKLFEHFAKHERLYRTLLGRNGSSWFVARVRDRLVALMDEREQLRAQRLAIQEKTVESRIPRQVAMTLASNLFISTVVWWLESGTAYSAKEIASWFLELATNGYVRVLGL